MYIKNEILICTGSGCESSRSKAIYIKFKELIKKYNLEKNIIIKQTGCFGLCSKGPLVLIYPEGALYKKVTVDDVKSIVQNHIIKNNIVKNLIYKDENKKLSEITPFEELNFFAKQNRLVLNNCGLIDANTIYDYLKRNGYKALEQTIKEKDKKKLIEKIKKSKLKGRGGAGYLTGLKIEKIYNEQVETKYVICNGNEGDPGAFIDRTILEGNPHCIIEAVTIVANIIGAKIGYIYMKKDYSLAYKRVIKAIKDAKVNKYLGDNILNSEFSFDINVVTGPSSFICGEETALIKILEGKRAIPDQKPYYPVNKGLFDKPTIVNNAETLANIPFIIKNELKDFLQISNSQSSGTKIITLSGNVKNPGLIEVPFGTKLREIVEEIGLKEDDIKIKALQVGGPLGGFIPYEKIDLKLDYNSLKEEEAIIGSGSIVVLDQSKCIVDMTRFLLKFAVEESCGKCIPCTIGGMRALEILENIVIGKGTKEDIEELYDLANTMRLTSLCGLGKSMSNPILSSLKNFRHEYDFHVENKKCNALYCKELIEYKIKAYCVGCTKCISICPTYAISGELEKVHQIDQSKCIKCDRCIDICPFDAIIKE
ncbi:MAG: 4Fe-4S binding protein [Peptostreptococcaceae bacterium]|nr:4Fe-4S binding protein [Peptostreptococcaceae bacterium]